jgi:hypothetical protein
MTAFTDIGAPLVAVGAKPFATTIQALRDNPIAIAEGDTTAPVNSPAWHPYDMVVGSDGAIGRFYNGTVVASVAAPTMELGYDYMFRGFGLSHNNGAATNFLINGTDPVGTTMANTTTIAFMFELPAPMVTNWIKAAKNGWYRTSTVGTNALFPASSFFTNFASGLSTFNFTWSAGSFDAGQMFMYRRRNYMS